LGGPAWMAVDNDGFRIGHGEVLWQRVRAGVRE
jgi:hypothetical protein